MTQHPSPEALIDYIHGELTPEADAAVHQHLATCAACREEYDAEVRVGEALRAAARAQEADFPSIVAARVWERVRSTRPSPLAGLAILLRPAYAVPLALALAFGAFFMTPLSHAAAPGHTVDAVYYLEQHAGQEASNPLSDRSSPPVIESSLVDAAPSSEIVGQSSVPVLHDALDVAR